jgi:hypothetical protein
MLSIWSHMMACKQPSPTNHVQHFGTRNPRLLLCGGKLVVPRCEDILGGKLSVHEVHGISCQTRLQFSKLVQLS